jgi:hypothetical protein
MALRNCNCGSGMPQRPLLDAAGIFCTFVCDQCEEKKRKHYRPIIFDPQSRYAQTGEEEDIFGEIDDIDQYKET